MNGKEKLGQFGRGFCMGGADVIPGVSGGTVALILGIYEELVESIRLLDAQFVRALLSGRFWTLLLKGVFGHVEPDGTVEERRVRALTFIGFLVLGIATAIVAGAGLITYCRTNFPEPTRGLFLGLVFASLIVPYRAMSHRGMAEAAVFVLSTVGTYVLLGLGSVSASPQLWYVFVCGAVAICAMILPGISGAFILLMMGMYDYVLEQLKAVAYRMDLSGLLPILVFITGIVVGITSFSRLLNYLLKRHRDVTMAALVGLMLGSLRVLWPWKDAPVPGVPIREEFLGNRLPGLSEATLWPSIIAIVAGIVIVFVLEGIGRKRAAAAATALLLLLAGCAGDSTCKCSYNCQGDVLYCVSDGDGGVLCYASADLVPSGQDDVATPEGDGNGPLADLAGADGNDLGRGEDLAGTDGNEPPPDDMDSPDDFQLPPDDAAGQDQVSPPDEVAPPLGPFEFRGVWVTRWDYKTAADVTAIMDKVSAWGFNAVMFQVRGNADAFYQSSVEPWAKELTGTLGKDPGWDPLAVAVAEAHERDMELHAWVNTFTAWTGTTPPPKTSPEHILYAHPDWRQADSSGNPMAFNNSYTCVSPGIPGVRQQIKSVVLDIAAGYDVDGIHFDYIRYAGPDYSHDTWSEDAYLLAKQSNPTLGYADFQRSTLAGFVDEAYKALGTKAPTVKVTASVWGIYQDNFGWGGTSEGYYDYYQDSHGWMGQGSLDAICPMIYWPLTSPKGGWTDFATLADDHLAAASGRHVYVGLNADYDSFDEIKTEIEYARSIGAPGYVVFAYSTLSKKGYGSMLADTVHAEPASPPPMGWK